MTDPMEDIRRANSRIEMRPVTDIEIEGIDGSDYPDFCDAYISNAIWEDPGEALTEEELDKLNENGEFVYEQVWKWLC